MPDHIVKASPLPANVDVDRARVDVCFRVDGSITANPAAGLPGFTVAVGCPRCGQSAGPWLMSSTTVGAVLSCRCGQRSAHPAITNAVVEERAVGFEAVWPSLAAAERGLLEGP
jgi:hypothetical protein